MAVYLMFLQHIIYSMDTNGKAAIVVPTGFLTAGSGIPKKIREHIVKNRMLRGVVSMPSNIFATTGTNVSIIFLDKENKDGQVVLMDASKLETKEKVDGKNQRTVLSQQEINNSPQQTFSGIAPGDVKYKDQNGDNRIDEKDVVKMFGSSLPRFYFGFNLNFSYKRFELSADFQGMTGVTVSLLDSPLYRPLVDNGNISNTFLNEEVYWTPENKAKATMPRLTTQENQNNYRASSLWYRDGSFLKLRNLLVAYTFPKSQTRFADLQVFVQGTNLFSLDNIHFADPEQLGIAYPSARSYWAGVKLNF